MDTNEGILMNTLDTLGPGFYPQISANEDNVIYSRVLSDSSALIRM